MNAKKVAVLDSGRLGGTRQCEHVMPELIKRGMRNALVSESDELITHWWLLDVDGLTTGYFGTQESFDKLFGR